MLHYIRFVHAIVDAAFIDPFRKESHYCDREHMTWTDFWWWTK